MARRKKQSYGNKKTSPYKTDAGKRTMSKRNRAILWTVLAVAVGAALIVALVVWMGTGNKDDPEPTESVPAATEVPPAQPDRPTDPNFTYSDGINSKGFWQGITASDYIGDFNYIGLSIPADRHEVSNASLQSSLHALWKEKSASTKKVTNRAVADGDYVNIDYVGSVDGVEFEGGNSDGNGADVTAGTNEFIDDFLTQIIGKKPGTTMNVEVTFPDDYSKAELAGQDAVFVTTINYITEFQVTDKFVKNNFSSQYGWKTVKEMRDGQLLELKKEASKTYIQEYLRGQTIDSIPDSLVRYQENSEMAYLRAYAQANDKNLAELFSTQGASTEREYLDAIHDELMRYAVYSLITQAIAEKEGISVEPADLEKYVPGYTNYEEQYGMPYLTQIALQLKAVDFIADNAVFA